MHRVYSHAKRAARKTHRLRFTFSKKNKDEEQTIENDGVNTNTEGEVIDQSSDNTTENGKDTLRRRDTKDKEKTINKTGSSPTRSPTETEKPKKKRLGIGGTLKAFILSSYANFLLIFVPIGIAFHFAKLSPTLIFVMNFLAIIPLAALLSFATEEVAEKFGEVIGGLMNASFGNAVELIVSIIALKEGELTIVQGSLLGSILSNLLLVLGMCFIFGGFKRLEQSFNMTLAQTSSSLLAVAVSSLLIPAAFHNSFNSNGQNGNTQENEDRGVLEISHGTSVIILLVYCVYLYFQLKSHSILYTGEVPHHHHPSETRDQSTNTTLAEGPSRRNTDLSRRNTGANNTVSPALTQRATEVEDEEDEDEDDGEDIPVLYAIIMLIVITVIVALCADFLVDSINEMVETTGISRTFVGLILLPIVGNAAEHVTGVVCAYKNKMDLAIGVAVGSSIQIALLVIPLLVIIGWIIGQPLTLYFNVFETVILFISVFIVNYLIQDGKSNYLEGVLLCSIYLIISVAVWYYPSDAENI